MEFDTILSLVDSGERNFSTFFISTNSSERSSEHLLQEDALRLKIYVYQSFV